MCCRTPGFASTEQVHPPTADAQGQYRPYRHGQQPLTAKADLYSLASLAYLMVTSRQPHGSRADWVDDARARDFETRMQVCGLCFYI